MPRKQSPVSSRSISAPAPNLFQRSADVEEPVAEPALPREKKTFHLEPDVVLLLSELQYEQHRATGKKPNLSDLVGEGVRLLAQSRKEANAAAGTAAS